MTESTLRRRLEDAFSQPIAEGDLSNVLTDALDAFVRECRVNGDPPERVLLKVKAIVAEIRKGQSGGRRMPTRAEQAFTERLIARCITSYYEEPPRPPSS